MRLVSTRRDVIQPAAVIPSPDGDRVLDLGAIAPDVVTILSDADAAAAARAAVAAVGEAQLSDLPLLGETPLAPPVVPGLMLAIGYNYAGHLDKGHDDADLPEFPNVFVKTPNTLSGPDEEIPIPRAAQEVDYEGEIAVVISRRAREVSLEDALDHVGGFTLFDDISARDWQLRTSQWTLGKCFDHFGQLGPAIVTLDEAGDLGGRELTVTRNGTETVRCSTDAMVFSVAFLVHHLSQSITLEPGDVIATGTPARLPEAQAVHVPVRAGDVVRIAVTGLGELTTRFVAPDGANGPDGS